MKRIGIFCLLLSLSGNVSAHHGVRVAYDTNNLGSIEGEVISVFWRNPHIIVTIGRTLEGGQSEIWKAEAGSVNSLERIGIGRDIVQIGDHVVLLGALSRQGLTTMAAYTMTLADGDREVPLWPQRAAEIGRNITATPISSAAAETSEREARGIFRIWSRTGTGLESNLSFTPEVLAAREGWDPLADDPALRCIPPGMPAMMNNPYPIEFVENGDRIILRLEEWDGVRTIHLSSDVFAENQIASSVGYSIGRWEGSTLIVTTTRISEPYFDDLGTPQGKSVEVVERFILNDDEDRLDYRVVITDPVTFTEPATLGGFWYWNPGEEIKPFQCALPDA